MHFESSEHALRWAYEVLARPIVKISSVNGMRGPERSCEVMTPQDVHTQAAMIISACERVLSPLQLAYVKIKYGCDGKGLELLLLHVHECLGSQHSRQTIKHIVLSYCGNGGGIREIKRSVGCGFLRAALIRSRGYDALDVIHAQAMDNIWFAISKNHVY